MSRVVLCIPGDFMRVLVAVAVLAKVSAATFHFLDALNLDRRPGTREACRHIIEYGESGDAVIVSSPYLYLPPCVFHHGGLDFVEFATRRPVTIEGVAFVVLLQSPPKPLYFTSACSMAVCAYLLATRWQ